MPDDYIKKHLARNIPTNFMDCCDRVRREFASREEGARKRKARHREADGTQYDKIYGGMISCLFEGDIPDGKEEEIGDEISEVQVRFEALQRTIDFSVPARPVHQAVVGVSEALSKAAQMLYDEERDSNIRSLLDLNDDQPMANTLAEFQDAQSLAERVTIAREMIVNFKAQVEKLEAFFNYKSGLVTAGKPSLYSVLYTVHALADIFESRNEFGRSASVNQIININQSVGEMNSLNARRYTGKFLDFVSRFFHSVDFAEIQRRQREGFEDSIRRFAQRRRRDSDLYKLLHGDDVTAEVLLQFMKRADAIK